VEAALLEQPIREALRYRRVAAPCRRTAVVVGLTNRLLE